VVLASTPDLQCGYSRDLFVAWCGHSKNSIILTSRTSPGTLARWLMDNPQDHVVRLE
ncbi:cleavage and polyadenylation specificity factor subunit 2, partial [Biomphalaria glabrata]